MNMQVHENVDLNETMDVPAQNNQVNPEISNQNTIDDQSKLEKSPSKAKFTTKCRYCELSSVEVDVVHITLFNLTHAYSEILPRIKAQKSNKEKESLLFSAAEQGPQTYDDSRVYFHYKADVSKFIDLNWSYFWNKPRGETWVNSASSALSTNSTENVPLDGRFESGKAKYNKNGMWALTDDSRLPSSYDPVVPQQRTRAVLFDITSDGQLVPISDPKSFMNNNHSNSTSNLNMAYQQSSSSAKKRRKAEVEAKTTPKSKKTRLRSSFHSERNLEKLANGSRENSSVSIAYNSYDESHVDLLSNKVPPVLSEDYKYYNPKTKEWSVKMWPDLDNPPGPVIMQSDPTHSAAQIVFEGEKNLILSNNLGYTSTKCSHGISTGTFYYEVEILEGTKPSWNLRIGWGQISANLQAPCGYDHYSYSMRMHPGTIFHGSIGQLYGDQLSVGDVLGVLIQLPDNLEGDYQKDIKSRLWNPATPYKPFDYKQSKKSPGSKRLANKDFGEIEGNMELPPIPILQDSEIVFFKNGEFMGKAFRGIFLGKYYPMISSYMGGKVKVNFGDRNSAEANKGFKFAPPELWNKRKVFCIDSLEISETRVLDDVKNSKVSDLVDQNNTKLTSDALPSNLQESSESNEPKTEIEAVSNEAVSKPSNTKMDLNEFEIHSDLTNSNLGISEEHNITGFGDKDNEQPVKTDDIHQTAESLSNYTISSSTNDIPEKLKLNGNIGPESPATITSNAYRPDGPEPSCDEDAKESSKDAILDTIQEVHQKDSKEDNPIEINTLIDKILEEASDISDKNQNH
ncbi:hypothetical protein BB560_006482 [Smittium megazygosporum]|uniref:B30.2/SPRY domain-containing protein n=1 Tax=Smittium megazygosporum TaxID=133381 RepID=A0A2T9Y556_9FUNG|nr:hypothetical protein BB560_006482 [Smittium megazygosporum]